ncbi:sugar phosphate isomerase/epimerase [Paraglaciecola aquimarina]|uniref:Sugar phosphate isomerase/epimerase n=1 Tax=Paraglaciecola aquimarina TaxID=1235557 RepID=A0ABU3SSL4_9ALTE|nr:sugar phosphate isomerase/epimerase [Paraglaciecola aquimarina]MDU0352962.1 sugar phosphate isomerase/epimerase [Paraglaciecola aquimarina]
MKKILLSCYLVLTLIGLSACGSQQQPNTKVNVPPISVQLWSVKGALKADFKGTLEELAGMGFQGVEFAGDFGPYASDPVGLKNYLTSIGLQASGAHVGFKDLGDDKLDKTLDFLKAVGIDMVIIPYDARAFEASGVHSLTVDLVSLSAKLAKKNMVIGYHNHDHEFNTYLDATYWDYIAKNTPQSVLLQLDVGWVNFAGKDPVEYVKRYPGRTLTTHLKIRHYHGPNRTPQGASPILGDDNYDWGTLITTQAKVGGTRWLVVEQEEYPDGLSSMQAVAKSKAGLDKIISEL